MRVGRSGIGCLVALGALGYLVVPVSSALGYTAPPPSPSLICFNASQANLGVLEASLSPANGATVSADSPVTFTGHSESMPTFAVASSAALLSSPDIDSGPGSAQPQPSSSGPPVVYAYMFSSMKATATPGTVYWQASFSSVGIAECAGLTPTTYTTSVRTLTVLPLPSPPTSTIIPTTTTTTPPAATGKVSLDGGTIDVQGSGKGTVELTCTGTGTCGGKLTLTAESTKGDGSRRGGQASSAMTRIGSARFSVSAGMTATVKLTLNATGRALLEVDHGRLSASLTILESSPSPSQTHAENVRLVQHKSHGKMGKLNK